MNHKRVERLWRREGLRVPPKAPRRRRLWLADGTTRRRRATRPNHVWSDGFVQDRTHDGRPLRLLCIVDEYTRECLAIVVARRLRADDILACLTPLFVERGPPAYLRSDNGPEFTASAVRSWLPRVGVTTLFIQPGTDPQVYDLINAGRAKGVFLLQSPAQLQIARPSSSPATGTAPPGATTTRWRRAPSRAPTASSSGRNRWSS